MSINNDESLLDVSSDDLNSHSQIELGFAQLPVGASGTVAATCRSWPQHWKDWPDGQVGGRPFWLIPSHLPPPSLLRCGNPKCGRTMTLLVQIYAPVSKEAIGMDSAFHRMIYVFACTKAKCASVAGFQKEQSFKVFRAQLPQMNPFYPYNETSEQVVDSVDKDFEDVGLSAAAVVASGGQKRYNAHEKIIKEDVCILCGCSGPNRCARCKGPRYCSREHQSLHWKNGHKEACSTIASSSLSSFSTSSNALDELDVVTLSEVTRASLLSGAILPCWELVVDSEPSKEERERLEEEKLPESVRERLADIRAGKKGALDVEADGEGDTTLIVPKSLKKSSITQQFVQEGVTEDGQDDNIQLSFRGLTQKQLVTATGAAMFADPNLRYFQRRVACEPAQCIRYCLWPPYEATLTNLSPSVSPNDNKTFINHIENKDNNNKEDVVVDDDDDASDVEIEPLGAPLWISSINKLEGPIPPCENCGAPRLFEIQIMPQILSYVLQGLKATVSATGPAGIEGVDLDFGTLAIYTCSKSCIEKSLSEGASPYIEECVWVQPASEDQLRVDTIDQAEEKEKQNIEQESKKEVNST